MVGARSGLPLPLLNPDEENLVPRAWQLVHGGGLDPGWYDYPEPPLPRPGPVADRLRRAVVRCGPRRCHRRRSRRRRRYLVARPGGVRSARGHRGGRGCRRRDDPCRVLADGRHGRPPHARRGCDARVARLRTSRVGGCRSRARRVGEVPRRVARRAARRRRASAPGGVSRPRSPSRVSRSFSRARSSSCMQALPGTISPASSGSLRPAGSGSRTTLRRRSPSRAGCGRPSARWRSWHSPVSPSRPGDIRAATWCCSRSSSCTASRCCPSRPTSTGTSCRSCRCSRCWPDAGGGSLPQRSSQRWRRSGGRSATRERSRRGIRASTRRPGSNVTCPMETGSRSTRRRFLSTTASSGSSCPVQSARSIPGGTSEPCGVTDSSGSWWETPCTDRVLAAAGDYPREARFYRSLARRQPAFEAAAEDGRWVRVYRIYP